MENIIFRIDKLLQHNNLSDFEKTFLPSIKSYYEKKNLLSPGQLSTLEKIEAKYSDEAQALHKAWIDSWNDEKKFTFKKVVDYYSSSGYYFVNILNKVRGNPEYVPTEKEYDSIVNNKYAQRFLKNADAPAKFQIGDLVQVRGNAGWDAGRVCIVIEDRGIKTWIRGGREYKISFVEDGSQNWYREADLKIAREKSVDSKKQQ